MCGFTIILFVIGFVKSEDFTLYEAKNAASETSCATGLLANVDVVVFRSRINWTADSGISTANFEIRNSLNKSLHFICDLMIPSDCSGNDISKCPCKKVDNTIFQIDINVSASIRYNGAVIHGHLYNLNHGIIKQTVRFPEVYESNNTTGILVINGKKMSTHCNVCETEIDDLHLSVNFSCTSPASPCVIQMSTNDSLTAVNSSNEIYFKKIVKAPVTLLLQIKYAACRMDGQFKSIECQIKIINRLSETTKNFEEITAISSALSIIILFLIVLLVLTNFRNTKLFWRWCANCHKPKGPMNTSVECDLPEGMNIDREQDIHSPCTHPDQSTKLLHEESTQYYGSDIIEILQCKNGVVNLKSKYDDCSKKKDHGGFFDVDDFDKHCLPEGFQDDYFQKLIHSMADLTVLLMVSVGKDLNSSRNLRIGNGWIGHVSMFEENEPDTCFCRESLLSTTPSKQYAKVVIYTSTLVVLNENEALLTTCRLFYDNAESPTIILKDCKYVEMDVNQEKIKLNYATCNPDVMKRLNEASKIWLDLYPKINEKKKEQSKTSKTVIMVSHIHGLHKRISIGKYLNIETFSASSDHNQLNSYIYDAPTCFGSTGAYVYIVSKDKKGFQNQHLHIGVNENGNKFSGKGTDYFR